MGGGVSKKPSYIKDDNISEIDQAAFEIRMVTKVESFIVQVFRNSKKVDCLWLVLSSSLGQKQFRKYLKKERVEEWLSFFFDMIKMNSSDGFDDDENEVDLKDKMINVIDSYMSHDSPLGSYLKSFFDDQIQLLFRSELEPSEVKDLFQQLIIAITDIMSNCFIDSFFISRTYYHWRCMEKSHAVALTKDDMNSDILKKQLSVKSGIDSIDSIEKMSAVLTPFNSAFSSFSKLGKNDLNELLEYRCEWLMTLLSTIDLLPIGCFLTKMNDNSNNQQNNNCKFPIIFMNRYMEVMTNKSHDCIINEKKNFVESFVMEETVNSLRFSIAQKEGKSFLGPLVLKREDIKDLKVMVGWKPIFDIHRNFSLGIGLIMDKNDDIGKVDVMQKLLDYLPDLIVAFDECDVTLKSIEIN